MGNIYGSLLAYVVRHEAQKMFKSNRSQRAPGLKLAKTSLVTIVGLVLVQEKLAVIGGLVPAA